jgi:RNA polymerase sigma-32 factor
MCPDPERTPEAQVADAEVAARVARAARRFAGTLHGRDLELFQDRWLAADDDPPTLADLGKRFGLSRERARQLEHRLLVRLRDRLTRDGVAAA